MPIEVNARLLDMQADGLPAQRRHILHTTFDPYPRPFGRYPSVLREDGDFPRSVVDLVEPDRDERHTPRAGDNAIYRNRAVLVPPGVVFELSDARASSREGAARNEQGQRKCRTETGESVRHVHLLLSEDTNGRAKSAKLLTGCGDASACLS